MPVDLDHPAGGFAHAKDQLRQFGASGADQPGEADDFAGWSAPDAPNWRS
jgi:hypothetical protein